jgi:hypothetical protein
MGRGLSQVQRAWTRISLLYERRLKAGEWSLRNARNIDRRVVTKSRLKMFGKSFVLSCDCVTHLPPHFTCGTILSLLHWLSSSFTVQSAGCLSTDSHTSHNDTEQSTIEASATLDGVTLTDPLIRWSPNECLQFDGRYQCLPIRWSGRLISLRNEHSIES